MIIEEKYIFAYALKNAIEHEGKAVAGSVISGLFNHGLTKDKVKDIMPKLNQIIKKVNLMDLDKQNKEFEKYSELVGHRAERGDELPELPNVGKNGVVMRFSPSPSGLMHLGHILTGMISSLYVKRYGGKFYLQIEDTNPEKINPKAYLYLKEDADWIFGNVSEVIIQSDRLSFYYKYVQKFINLGKSYVCDCDSEEWKELSSKSKSCKCRNLSNKEQILRWKKMLDSNGYKDGEAVLRFKSDLDDPNPAMRDFPLARINTSPHERQGKKYRVWPLMNLAVTVDDIELKKTHIIRAKEHMDNAARQKMMYEALGLSKLYPQTYFLGRWKFDDLPLSKSQTQKLIDEGKFRSWDDIRIPIVRNFRKRGYLPEAFKKIIIQRGLSEVDKVISQKDFFELLNNFNRQILKDIAKKASFETTNEKDANIMILMPDNDKVFGKSDAKPNDNDIFYFERFGYAKFNGVDLTGSGSKQIFWFCHS